MKKVLSLMLALVMMLALAPVVQADEHFEISLNGEWEFKYYPKASDVPKDVTEIVFEDKIQVPGAMELQGYGYPSYFYEEAGGWGQPEDDGVRSAGVYKLDFSSHVDYPCWMRFDNVRDNLKVYINGEKVGESKNGSLGSVIKVPVKDGENTMICVVERDNSGINKKDDFAISGIMGNVTLTNGYTIKNQKVSAEIRDNTLTIDGKEVVLKGVKYTPTHPENGNIMTESQIDKDLELIKEYGFNSVWTSGAPEYFYKKAEEMGLYVIDEANINLSYVDRDMETAKNRIKEMIERHSYKSVIMWSVGSGSGNAGQLIDLVKSLDSRPVAQEVNFAEDFKVFGNTGGMKDWVETLGEGNVGGFVDEFADKELYYTQSAYLFDVKDSVTGEKVTIDGEVENYMGTKMLGDASFVRNIDKLDKYTIVTELGVVEGDRVIFEKGDIKFEVRGGRARFNVGDKRVRADVYEGKVAAVYMDGEIQLFVNNAFVGNEVAEAEIEGEYKVGGGETAIGYIEIYNDALTLDELLEGADENKLVSRIDFENIDVKEDKSYSFLAYGGDFGDNPNSYYKCLTGIFSSTREPHPEAVAFGALLNKKSIEDEEIGLDYVPSVLVEPAMGENEAVFESAGVKVTVGFDGKITSVVKDNELLKSAIYPTVLRENTLSEYEMGVENQEGWRSIKAEVIDKVLYITLVSTQTEGRLNLAYSMADSGVMHVSMQSEFADDSVKPTFIGFRGAGEFETVSWLGCEESTYPDRQGTTEGIYTKAVPEMSDNYAVPQENGNRSVYGAVLEGKNGKLAFSTATIDSTLQFQVLDYSPDAMDAADHDEDIEKDGNAYFRVGGFIKGVGGNHSYDLSENVYGYDFYILANEIENAPEITKVKDVYINGETYNAFTTGVKNYVYQTNEVVKVTANGGEVVQDDKKAVIGDYVVCFAPATEYMSDMTPKDKTAEIALDTDFNGNAIEIRGNDYWAAAQVYDKGVALKNGSVTYDVSAFNNHVFNAVIGKNDFDWRMMGGGFDRNMFDASCTVTISLDGVVVEEVKDISMRGGSKAVSIDVSDAKEMTITAKGNGKAVQYEDAVIANGAFVPNGPVVVNFEKKDGKATITVLNTDEDKVDIVLGATENGTVTSTATTIGKGLYKTISITVAENATVKALITGLGTITLE